MAKKKKSRSWFSLIKSFFISEPKSRQEKDKRKRWVSQLVRMKERERLAWQPPEQSSNNSALPVIVAIDNAPPVGQIQNSVGSSSCQHEMASRHQAATKIQTAFRAYLARKALGALKGVVKLQAVIRGWTVRQQAIKTLKCLQSIVSIQSQVCSKRCETFKDCSYCYSSQDFRGNDIKVDLNSQKRWEHTALTKEELKGIFLTKGEASIKRERVKEYYLNHRRSAETERDKVHGRQRYWLEQWVDAQLAKSETLVNLDRDLPANARTTRRSYHHRKQRSTIEDDDNAFPGSPAIIPAYMASTESAKAKARSLSSPRLRPLSFDVCSEITSPYKHKLSPLSSINSELIISSSWMGDHPQRPSFLKGPIKSTMSVKDLRIRGAHYQKGDGHALTYRAGSESGLSSQ